MPRSASTVAAAGCLLASLASAQCPSGPTFGALATFPLFATDLRSMVAADLDGDRDLDLALAGRPHGLAVLRNDAGTFVPLPVQPMPHLANGLCAGDFDGDGRVDLACCGNFLTTTSTSVLIQGTVDVLRNVTAAGSGAIGFAAPQTILIGTATASGSNGSALVAEDFDADGAVDLAVADMNSTNVWVVRGLTANGRPTGAFGAPTPIPIAMTMSVDLECADFDRDGFLDLATLEYGDGHPGRVTLLQGGTPPGSFVRLGSVSMTNQCQALVVRDFDADGWLDLAAAGSQQVAIARGTAPFTFALPVGMPCQFVEDLAAADLDGDGRLDLCAGRAVNVQNPLGNVSVWRNLPAGFVEQGNAFGSGYPGWVATEDFDGDGIVDAAIGKWIGSVAFARGTCTGGGPGVSVVTAPVGGETWTVGAVVSIDWITVVPNAPVDVELSRDGGRSWQRIAAGVTTNPLPWRVSPPSTNRALVRVRASSAMAAIDTSDAVFAIGGPGLAMATAFGTACGTPAPVFDSTVPHFDGAAEFELRGGAALAPVGFYVSLPTAAPLPIGGGCTIYLDVPTLALVHSGVSDALGTARALVAVPGDPALLGRTFPAQAAVLVGGAPPGVQLSNGVSLRLGF